jgi:hypothetical protein
MVRSLPGFGQALVKSTAVHSRRDIHGEARAEFALGNSTIIGVNIQGLTIDLPSSREAFELLVQYPLGQLAAKESLGDVLLIIDGLDVAAKERSREAIPALLANSDLAEGVRILATTRSDPDVMRFFSHSAGVMVDWVGPLMTCGLASGVMIVAVLCVAMFTQVTQVE